MFIDENEMQQEENINLIINKFWNTLNQQEKLYAFCAVIKRLNEAELNENRSFRGVLYDKFEFSYEAYGLAQLSGFLQLHNSIYTKNDILNILKKYLIEHDIKFTNNDIENFNFFETYKFDKNR